ncbi:MAG TPA: hypothetical protein VMU24_00095 [Candidatus Acidoferrales bacterium]|nr:hypothetical protein [Candidatus Acidoferrales bacterium]
MSSHDDNIELQRATAGINLNRNERQKCVLLCEHARLLRHASRTLIVDTGRVRGESVALRDESIASRSDL